jgi:hypothetical protein
VTAVTAHAAAATLVLCRRSRPDDDETQDRERTDNEVGHDTMLAGTGLRLPNDYLYEHAKVATAGTASRSRGTASTTLAGTDHVNRLWTVTLPVGPAT